ncbi:MAG: ATP-dependent helicase, partial [Deltaproteobacteria bacterium]|nr:ATP-dependent helicase [Deltaproteobacteria bacterium]
MKVVQAGSGTFAVVGNPGSGKTSAIVARVARLVRDGVHPKWILAMTFTVKAADELTLRLGRLGIKGGRFGTIHSVALQILRDAESWIADLELDVKESMLLELKRILDGMRQKRKIPQTGVDYAQVQAYVDACKSRRLCWVYGDPWGVNDRTYRFLLDEAHAWKATTGLFPKELLDVYLALEEKRSSKGVYSFDDMLLWCWMSLSLRRDVRETWRKNWALVIVDEAQDSSLMQWDLSRYLAGLGTTCDDLSSLAGRPEADDGEHNLMAVGDVSQSLYSFRNARPEQFLEYASEKGTTLLTLPISYRAVPWLCQGASVILKGKPWHLGGDILPARAPLIFEGPPPLQEMRFQDPLAEMNWILDDATRRHEKGLPWRSMAVLSRLSMFLHFLETECARRGLAYELRASGSSWDSQDVQCLLG